MTLRIGLLGSHGSSNLGNVAIGTAAIQNLSRLAAVDLLAISKAPDDTAAALRIPAVEILPWPRTAHRAPRGLAGRISNRLARTLSLPGRHLRAWRHAFGTARELDLVIVAGGGQLDDFWGGPLNHPYSLFVWVMMARLAGTPAAIVSVGYCELRSPLSRLFTRLALRQAAYVSFRQRPCVKRARTLRLVKPAAAHVVSDLAYSLEPPRPAAHDRAETTTIAIMPIAQKAWRIGDDDHARYLDTLTDVAARLLGAGYRVRLFTSVRMDSPVAQELRARVLEQAAAGAESRLTFTETSTLDSLCKELASCDVVVASRLHSVLLAQLMRKPVVALSPFRKATQLMADNGLSDYCIELADADPDTVSALVSAAERNAERISKDLDRLVHGYRAELADQYSLLISLARNSSAEVVTSS